MQEDKSLNLKDISDEVLVARACEKDKTALNILFLRYDNLLNAKVKYFCRSRDSLEDYLQEAKIGLYKAILNFDGEKCPWFAPFAKYCVEHSLLNFVKKESRRPQNEIVEDFDHNTPEKLVIDSESFGELLEKIDITLSPFESSVLSLYITDISYEEIARKLGKNTKSVDNALLRIKRKLAQL